MNIAQSNSWSKLLKHSARLNSITIQSLFENERNRVQTLSMRAEGLYVDFSKNRLDRNVMKDLFALAKEATIAEQIKSMFRGDNINFTENRPVLHIALRNRSNTPIFLDGKDIMPGINHVLAKMEDFSNKVRSKTLLGATGKPIRNIVNIGIGGSHLGPEMAYEALKSFALKNINIYFVSNIDGSNIRSIISKLDAEETLFIISSKTFTTDETMANVKIAQNWLSENITNKSIIHHHFVAVSSNKDAVTKFGISSENTFEFWDFVGGRYSLASAIGISLMVAIGPDHFYEMLDGMHKIDNHFLSTPIEKNAPVLLALITIWNSNFLNYQTEAIIPYSHQMRYFPKYLQQAGMESNGKSINKYGQAVDYNTSPIIWGDSGTNAQHAFFQLLHQGTSKVPCDFIGFIKPLSKHYKNHTKLIANMFAQAEALAFGKDSSGNDDSLSAHRSFPGNSPSNTILADELTPTILGQLIALYEHKYFVEGVIWQINSFDQFGVELGKNLAKQIYAYLNNEINDSSSHDSSTISLMNIYKDKRY